MSASHGSQRQLLLKLVRELQARKFYGKVELDIQGGNILRAIKHESVKFSEGSDGKQSDAETRTEGRTAQEPSASP